MVSKRSSYVISTLNIACVIVLLAGRRIIGAGGSRSHSFQPRYVVWSVFDPTHVPRTCLLNPRVRLMIPIHTMTRCSPHNIINLDDRLPRLYIR